MKQKYIALALFIVTVIWVGLGYLVWLRPDLLGICQLPLNIENGHCLDSKFLWGVVFPIMELTYLLPLFLLLAFVRADVFKLWWKFAIPFGLFLLYTISNMSPDGGSGGWVYVGPTRTEATYFSSLWLLTSSCMLLALKTWKPSWRAYYTIPAVLIISLIGLIFAGVRTFFL